ncbi:LysE family translocator [Streptomyces chrestomyceticus]|uniref:LysE family translocator n=1 Tax=Streptomyces chrestomyceticus TaxID=68185 RepID=UPI0019D2035A|nr:LysE family translocator [Streptomyces chrestomyceticus]
MFSDVSWAAFFPSALLLAATPGANQLLALRNGVRHGLRPALGASLGRFTAFTLMVIAVAAGLGAVLTRSAVAFNVIKWCGVAYLLWLGAQTLRTALCSKDTRQTESENGNAEAPAGEPDMRRKAPALRLARQEFLVAMTNPKALILFAVFLPQFLSRDAHRVTVPLLALGFAYIAVEFFCAWGYAALGGRLKKSGIGNGTRRRLDVVTAVAMWGLAGWLATENR